MVSAATQTLTFTLANTGMSGDVIPLEATVNSGLPVTYESSAPAIAEVRNVAVGVGQELLLKVPGRATITASQEGGVSAGNVTYTAATAVAQEIMVSTATQVLVFNSTAMGEVGETIALDATGGASGQAVGFEITGEFEADGTTRATAGTVATFNAGTGVLTLVGVGEVEITATQAGNATYAEATQMQTITVSQGTQTVTITSGNTGQATINTIALTATAVNASGVATGSAITYEIVRETPTTRGDDVADLPAGSNLLELTRQGTVEIRAIAAGDVNTYAEATDTQVITVSADPVFDQTFTFNLAAGGTSGDEITLTATSRDVDGNEITGLPDIVYAIASGSNNPTTRGDVATLAAGVLTLASPGMISITASREAGRGDDGKSYGAATAVTQEITVAAATQTLTFNLVADGTSGAVISLTATVQNADGDDITALAGLPAITYTSSEERFAMVRGEQELLLKTPGTAIITALRGGGIVGGVTYAAATDVTQNITVGEAPQTLTFTPPANAGQVGEVINLTATANSGLEVTLGITAQVPAGTGDVATFNAGTGVLTLEGVGSVTVTASQAGDLAGDVTYAAATDVTQTFTVSQGTQTVAITSGDTGQAGVTTIALVVTVVNASGIATGSTITYEIVSETPTTARDDVADLPTGSNMLELRRPGMVEVRATAAGDANTYAEATDTQVITVTADPVFPQTFVFNLAAGGTSGDEITLTATSQDAGGNEITGLPDIVYAIAPGSNNPTTVGGTVATLAAGVLTLASPGTVSITASRGGGRGDNGIVYAAATAVTQDITVAAAEQTLVFTLADGTSGESIGLMVTSQDADGNDIAAGLPGATYRSSAPDIAEVRAATGGGSGYELVLLRNGSAIITASRGGGTVGGVTYAAAVSVDQEIIVSAATQTLVFDPTPPLTGTSGEMITLRATSTSGLDVELNITNQSPTTGAADVATLDAGTDVLTLANPGMVTITASQAGGTVGEVTYGTATDVTQEIMVSAAEQVLVFTLADGISGESIDLMVTSQDADGNDIAAGLPTVTYTSDAPGIAEVSGQQLVLKALGTATITASRGGGTVEGVTYAAATDVIQDITVSAATQTLTFTPPATSGQVGEVINLTATANSGLEVTLGITAEERPAGTAVADGTVATLDAGTGVLTLVGVGEVVATAMQAGGVGSDGVTYAAATPVTQTITVSQGTQTVAITSGDTGQAGTTTIALMATVVNASGVATGSVITYEIVSETPTTARDDVADLPAGSNMLELKSPGMVEIRATAAGDANTYAEAMATQMITVTADPVVAQVLTFNSTDMGEVGETITLDATAGPGLDVTFEITAEERPAGTAVAAGTVATLDAGVLTLVGVGEVVVTAMQAGGVGSDGVTYAAATPVTQTITVSAIPLTMQTITFMSDDTGDVGTDIELMTTVSSGLDVTFAVTAETLPDGSAATSGEVATLDGNGTTLSLIGAGTVTITATQAGGVGTDGVTYAPATQTQTITIMPMVVVPPTTQTLAFTSPVEGQAGSTITLVATATSTGAVTYAITEVRDADGNVVTNAAADAVATLSGSTLTLLAAGMVTITATQAGGDIGGTIYAAATQTQVITITPVVLGIEEDADDFVLYPNPTSGKLHFSEQVGEFRLYSVEGRVLEIWKNVRSVDLMVRPSGMYFAEVIRDGRSTRYRIMRE